MDTLAVSVFCGV